MFFSRINLAVEWEDRNLGSLATKSQMLPDQVKKDATKNHAHWMERKSGSRFSAAWRFRTPTNSEKMKHCRAKTKVQRYK